MDSTMLTHQLLIQFGAPFASGFILGMDPELLRRTLEERTLCIP